MGSQDPTSAGAPQIPLTLGSIKCGGSCMRGSVSELWLYSEGETRPTDALAVVNLSSAPADPTVHAGLMQC